MNTIPSELRTPPLPLISFIGCPELHKELGTYFSQTLRPPLVSIGIAEANEVLLSRLFGTSRPTKPFATPDGILKADWFVKQRQRRAAVALVLTNRGEVEGDPTTWMRMLSQLKAVRQATSHKGAGMLVLILQEPGSTPDLPADRVAGICNNLDLTPKQLFPLSREVFASPDRLMALHQALAPLGAAVMEAAAAYYAAGAQRQRSKQLDLSAALGSVPPEINVSVAFKLAVLAEFRQDWLTAVSCYQTAYAALRGVPLGSPQVSVQRHAEVVRVAELIHFKAMMLLLHQQRGPEALAQLREHLALWGAVPAGFTAAAAASHHAWCSRQYLIAAEMVAGRLDEATLQENKDCSPGFLALAAAHLAVSRKAAAETARQQRGGAPPSFDLGCIKKGGYVGQVMRKTEPGSVQDLSDAEYCSYLEAEEARLNHSQMVLEGIAAALDLFQEPQAERVRSQLLLMMAQQHIDTNNLLAARKLLLQVAHVYRRDGWDVLLLQVLLQLRDCCARLKLHKDTLLCSLELAALLNTLGRQQQQQVLDPQQAQALATAAASSMLAGGADKKSGIMKTAGTSPGSSPGASTNGNTEAAPESPRSCQPQQQAAAAGGGMLEYQVHYLDLQAALQQPMEAPGEGSPKLTAVDCLIKHHQQDFGWWRCISMACSFQEAPPDPLTLHFCIAMYSHVPVPLGLQGVGVAVADPEGSWEGQAVLGPPPRPGARSSAPDGGSMEQQLADRQASSPGTSTSGNSRNSSSRPPGGLVLQPGRWLLLHVPLSSRCIGLLKVDKVMLQLSSHCLVNFHLSSFPMGLPGVLGGGPYPEGMAPFPTASKVRPGVWAALVGHVGPLPTLQIRSPPLSLVGEFTPLQLVIRVHAALVGANLELSLRSPTGAVPGQVTLLALLPDGKLHALALDAHQLALPDIPAGCCHVLQLWLRSPVAATSVKLSALLTCPASVSGAVVVRFEEPFEGVTRVMGEPRSASLVTPSPAYQAAAAAVAPGAGMGGGSSSSKALPLVIGEPVMAQMLVRVCQAADLELLGVDVELPEDSGVQLLNELSAQMPQQPPVMSQGSIHCFLLHLVPTAMSAPSTTTSLGSLQLRWKRVSPPVPLAPSDSTSTCTSSSSSPPSPPVQVPAGEAAGPGAEVVTSVVLPSVVVMDSWLRIKAASPSHVTAGLAFAFTLQLHNTSSQLQEVQVLLQDTQGFIFSGDKQQQLVLQPREHSSVSWSLVAHVSGQLLLPSVQVTAVRLNCTALTQSSYIHVVPF